MPTHSHAVIGTSHPAKASAGASECAAAKQESGRAMICRRAQNAMYAFLRFARINERSAFLVGNGALIAALFVPMPNLIRVALLFFALGASTLPMVVVVAKLIRLSFRDCR